MRLPSILALLLIPGFVHAAPLTWYTDFSQAMTAAQAENKVIMLDFTGSDWCGWCIKLKKEVFDTPEFAAYAAEKLVLVEVDFPQHKSMTVAQRTANDALARKYQIRGYPTLILVDSVGAQKGQSGYIPGGPNAFLADLNRKIDGRGQQVAAVPPAPVPAPPTPPAPIPSYVAPPNNFADLQLKGISGSKKHRMALINGEAFEVNDESKLTVSGKELKVKCVEISNDVVKITVDGEARELKLKE